MYAVIGYLPRQGLVQPADLKGGEKVKNRIISISLAVMLALSVGLIGCGSEEVPETTEYNLTVSTTEGGKVTDPGEGTFSYEEGEMVTLVAEADEGYRFVNWTGDVGTVGDVADATTTVTMNGDYSIMANFASDTTIPLKNPGSFVQMMMYDVDSLDPPWSYDIYSAEQVQYIYETLIFYDGEKTDQFVPVLATEWKLLGDNVTYRFKIREGVKFHEGGDLTPEDVEYSFERAMVQNGAGGPTWMLYQSLLGLQSSRDESGNIQVTFDQIDNAVEVDGDWVQFNLVAAPYPPLAFHQILCGPYASIVDEEWCVAQGEWDGTEDTWTEYNNPEGGYSAIRDKSNGTGPWKLEEWEPGVHIKLLRNDDYWREPAAFETVVTKFVKDWTTRKSALMAGDADLVYVQPACIGELEGIADLNVYKDLPELLIDALFFNFNIGSESEFIGSGALDGDGIPPDFFSDVNVRKGFCYAFDSETYINDALMGEAEQRGSPVIEGLPFYNPDASMYSHDLAKAEEHLKAAWDGQVWEKGFKFTLVYNVGHLAGETARKILGENLAAINPKFQVSILPASSAILPMIKSRTMPAFGLGWGADYPHPNNMVTPFMTSYGVLGQFQSYGSPELDQLIEHAFREPDPVVQRDMYYEIQERYYEDAPGIMLCQPLGRRYFTKYIKGFYFNPMISGKAGPLYYMSKSES
jgi:peptide/nickel transport system substrate-binding protein